MPSAKTTSAIGHIGKGFADAIGTYVRLKMALNKEKERQDLLREKFEFEQQKTGPQTDIMPLLGGDEYQNIGASPTQKMAGLSAGYGAMERFEPMGVDPHAPKPMTEMESLKVQEQKLKVAKMLRDLEQGGQDKAIGKTPALIHAKTEAKAYSDYLKESPDEDISYLTRMLTGKNYSKEPVKYSKLSPSAWKGSRELPKQWSPEPSAFDKRGNVNQQHAKELIKAGATANNIDWGAFMKVYPDADVEIIKRYMQSQ